MLILQRTIEQVKEVAPSDIIKHYVADLKKNGVNWQGCCPFHAEKTPSFSVNDSKNLYKCFGCGAGGDGIKFIMEHEKQTFQEAIITIAKIAGIPVEYEERELSDKEKQFISDADLQEKILNFIIPIYQKQLHSLPENHPAKVWLYERKLTDDDIKEWNLGWSPADWKFITPKLIDKGWYDMANRMGIIKRKNENNWDGYRSRIIFPIDDRNGKFIGIGGRFIDLDGKAGENVPKYINPENYELYNKSSVLYGLSKARKEIEIAKSANVVEGYMDVISPYKSGIKNTVGTCGTAFTENQIKLLKRYTNNFNLWFDNDNAGINATIKALPELVKANISAKKITYDIDVKDPDAYTNAIDTNENFKLKSEDAIIWYASKIWNECDDNIHEQSIAKKTILELIAKVPSEIFRNNYLDSIISILGFKAGSTKKEFNSIFDSENVQDDVQDDDISNIKFYEWMTEEQKETAVMQGYLAIDKKEKGKRKVGYYSFSSNGKTEITNFIITPLFHIYAGVESRYLLQIDNGRVKAVLDIPARIIPSPEQFQSIAVSESNFMIYGSKIQWLRVASDILANFQRCEEIVFLGWQPRSKFFAWVDKIYVPKVGIKELNQWGIYNHHGNNFLIPASSEAYKKFVNSDNDPYEDIRNFKYVEAKIDFKQWAEIQYKVYKNVGLLNIAFIAMTIYKDLITSIDNNFPHLYYFGEPGSGKSKAAESVAAIFYKERAAFNLNSGTDAAFFSYVSKYSNTINHLNEFDIETIKNMDWFQAIKGWFDGESRQRMKMSGVKGIETMKSKGGVVLTGQKLVTIDDNSVVTRCLIEGFGKQEYSDKESKLFFDLKKLEKDGLTSLITAILDLQETFVENYKKNFFYLIGEWRRTKSGARQISNRILQNWAFAATAYNTLSQELILPAPAGEFENYCYAQAVRWNKFISTSDTLSEFWRTVEFLYSQGDSITEGWDFIIEKVTSVKIRISRTEEKIVELQIPSKVLFLRINNIHKHFQQVYRSRTGKEAMTLDNLLHYFQSRKYFIGNVKQKTFKRIVVETKKNEETIGPFSAPNPTFSTAKKEEVKTTSCYAFLFEELELDIGTDNEEKSDTPIF